ncbi:hypothetical protein JXA32_16585 [Candidatus Sumerlaeota bacterium]|nr:hypothetical protein [Candidatus Sumerlaeota bacterium]
MTGETSGQAKKILDLFAVMYGADQADACAKRFDALLQKYSHLRDQTGGRRWDEGDALLITYSDMARRDGEAPLRTLKRFADERLQGAIRAIHILPFFPYSSDDGFSVIDYRQVNPAFGEWSDVEAVNENFDLMFDLVLNHCSAQGEWFQNYLQGREPGLGFFIEASPDGDWSRVVRPRSLPLFTEAQTSRGPRHVWTTFSADQVDLNFANPDVLFELFDILLSYLERGARIIRLDAIAFLWKEAGTSCLHLPQTHAAVKLMRAAFDAVAPGRLLLTETNVPHRENVSYFGNGDEAHVVYQFSLAPLILLAMLKGDATLLTQWARDLEPPREGCAYLNFTASHDGVGVRPLEGIAPREEVDWLVQQIERRDGRINTKRNPDGTDSPYELCCTWFSAVRDPDAPDAVNIERFLTSQAIMLAMQGIPAIYFHSLMGAENDYDGLARTQQNRTLNRMKWNEPELLAALDTAGNPRGEIFRRYTELLRIRAKQPAFHPDARQEILETGPRLFAVLRRPDEQAILAVHNVSAEDQVIELPIGFAGDWTDLFTGESLALGAQASIPAHQFQWFAAKTRSS